VRKITCHRAVAASLRQCLAGISPTMARPRRCGRQAWICTAAAINFRAMRGATCFHALYGIAIDLDPEHNPQGRSGGRIKG